MGGFLFCMIMALLNVPFFFTGDEVNILNVLSFFWCMGCGLVCVYLDQL